MLGSNTVSATLLLASTLGLCAGCAGGRHGYILEGGCKLLLREANPSCGSDTVPIDQAGPSFMGPPVTPEVPEPPPVHPRFHPVPTRPVLAPRMPMMATAPLVEEIPPGTTQVEILPSP